MTTILGYERFGDKIHKSGNIIYFHNINEILSYIQNEDMGIKYTVLSYKDKNDKIILFEELKKIAANSNIKLSEYLQKIAIRNYTNEKYRYIYIKILELFNLDMLIIKRCDGYGHIITKNKLYELRAPNEILDKLY